MAKELKNKDFLDWIKLRNNHPNDNGEKLCYCDHTKYCQCADPDLELFEESVARKTINLNDPDNGWVQFHVNEVRKQ